MTSLDDLKYVANRGEGSFSEILAAKIPGFKTAASAGAYAKTLKFVNLKDYNQVGLLLAAKTGLVTGTGAAINTKGVMKHDIWFDNPLGSHRMGYFKNTLQASITDYIGKAFRSKQKGVIREYDAAVIVMTNNPADAKLKIAAITGKLSSLSDIGITTALGTTADVPGLPFTKATEIKVYPGTTATGTPMFYVNVFVTDTTKLFGSVDTTQFDFEVFNDATDYLGLKDVAGIKNANMGGGVAYAHYAPLGTAADRKLAARLGVMNPYDTFVSQTMANLIANRSASHTYATGSIKDLLVGDCFADICNIALGSTATDPISTTELATLSAAVKATVTAAQTRRKTIVAQMGAAVKADAPCVAAIKKMAASKKLQDVVDAFKLVRAKAVSAEFNKIPLSQFLLRWS